VKTGSKDRTARNLSSNFKKKTGGKKMGSSTGKRGLNQRTNVSGSIIISRNKDNEMFGDLSGNMSNKENN
jgi:hypothetical protein